ncbi:hypothetical protein CAL29_22720 [Bordetella genomosp. 10]|uniref:Prenyltransferase alpha-alpha toroid domain-containing protein n=1 Tax=Bordetella genomosp. 10 TaxID=1416804 RepID=A0A261S0C7_9BORD|nr:prenyltransferase/squalene oxidase repeat-containing protein [Bordetella genomosp. 10]OZI30798.1 hypothetical protein CAL29_22720 [Bordetella genomosp. 10]
MDSSPLAERLPPMRLRARDYLLSRQSPEGGFCAYRGYYVEEPNLADTWRGVSAWRLLTGEALPQRDRHAAFLARTGIAPQAISLYQRVRAFQALRRADPSPAQVRDAVAALPLSLPQGPVPSLQAPLRQLRQTLWLKRHFGLDDTQADEAAVDFLRQWQAGNGGYGRPPNLHDTAEALALLHACRASPDQACAGFVRRVELRAFGFRLTAASLSPSLETTCAGLNCCVYLGIVPRYADDAARFIVNCQAGSGGFALRPDAKPGLDLTYLALCTLGRSGYLGTASTP